MFKVVEIVEIQITFELKRTRKGILYDGWNYKGTLFIGSFVAYMRDSANTGYI